MSKSCDYSPSQHFTASAQQAGLQTCVSKTMKQMSDPQKCIAYMSGVLAGQDKTRSCTLKDMSGICSKYGSEFSVGDARSLCQMKNSAETRFWAEKKKS